MVSPGRSVPGEREGWLNPDGLGVGVPSVVPIAAVRSLAGDPESSTDVGPGGAPVDCPGDGGVNGVLGSGECGGGAGGGGERVGAESFGPVHQGVTLG